MAVDDADGDPLTLTWTITRGTLTAQNTQKSVMNWAVPAAVGIDTVEVTVSDGTFTRKVTEEIRVCWPVTGARATFAASQSPFLLSLDAGNPVFPVDAGTETVIEAGVEILLENEQTVIDVSGRLVANGTVDEPVVIRPNVRHQTCGDERGWWLGIRGFTSAGPPSDGDIELHHTEVWYALHGVRLINQASAALDNCAIRCSGTTGVLHEGSGTLSVVDTEVSNGASHGIVIGGNLVSSLPDSVHIEGCEIRFNASAGLVVNIDDQSEETPIIVEYNRIENNALRGVTLARASFPALHFNSLVGNGVGAGLSSIYLEDGYPNGVNFLTLNATCNYFGATSQASIDAAIRDSLDNPGLVATRVDTDPWLAASPITTPPNCTP